MMRKITEVSELRALQIALLDELVRFCNERQITYFLSSGTLIGAVRHKGYIPWDDDIDLYMPRKDYERLVREYPTNNDRFELLEPRRTPHYFYTFAKLEDTRTVMVEKWYDNYPIGIYIDIFPIDYVTSNPHERKRVFWWKKNLFRIYTNKCVRLLRDRNPYHIFKRLVCKLIPLPASYFNKRLRRLQKRYPYSPWVCNMTETGPRWNQVFPTHCIEGSVDVTFEGKTYKTMQGYHEYLKATFGNYMQLPPEDQRVRHLFDAYYKDEKE